MMGTKEHEVVTTLGNVCRIHNRCEETDLRKADRTGGVNCYNYIFSTIFQARLPQGMFTTEERHCNLNNQDKNLSVYITIKSGITIIKSSCITIKKF